MGELRPRVARPAGTAWNLVKTWLQVIGMWGTFFFALPCAVHAIETAVGLSEWRFASDVWATAGMVLFGAFGVLGLSLGGLFATHGHGTPLPFDTAPRLIVSGPYRHIRNPMAVASFGQGFGVALYLGSPLVVIYVFCGIAIWQFVARPWEERDLRARFGTRYEAYRDAVPCWRLRLTPYREESGLETRENSAHSRASGST